MHAKKSGYSVLVVVLIVAVIAILGMIGAQKMFEKRAETPGQDYPGTISVPAPYIPPGVGVFLKDPTEKAFADAVRKADTERVGVFLRAGVNPNISISASGTALHRAAARGLVDIARMLLDHKANVNAPNPKSITPLHLAARNGHGDMVELLIDYGAEISPENDEGQTPVAMALQGLGAADPADADSRRRYEKTIDLLRSWGAK